MKFAVFSPMPEPDLIELFVFPLNRLGIRYLVSGSVAAMMYGEPRVTHDVDLIVFLRADDVSRLIKIFPAPEFYLPPADVILAEMSRERRGHFNIIHADSGLKADFYLANRDELHAWAFRNMKQYSIGENTVKLAPPEYVIVRKLEYFREGGSEKHLRDIRAMLAVSGGQLDRAALDEMIRERGLKTEWSKASP
jgi:hypothetical protein